MSGPKGIPPWHMWGSSETLDLAGTGVAGQNDSTLVQLSQINYGRPETWEFLFDVKVSQATGVLTVGALSVIFDLTIGLGRSTIQMPAFAFVTLSAAQFANVVAGAPFEATITTTEKPKENTLRVGNNVIEAFPAQAIQLTARCNINNLNVATARISVASYFSPRAHVRPEWFSEEFPGGENQGH